MRQFSTDLQEMNHITHGRMERVHGGWRCRAALALVKYALSGEDEKFSCCMYSLQS
jgi:hypothetical protein